MSYRRDDQPVGGMNYDPNNPAFHGTEGTSSKPTNCALVLRTLSAANTEEYRIGQFKSLGQIDAGLRRKDQPAELNIAIARSYFGDSPMFNNRTAAIKEADKTYRKHTGIKVLRMHCAFPG